MRHGQSTWNLEGRWQGWADPPLTDLGLDQARAALHHLTGLDRFAGVVSSDLQRAQQTAEVIASGLALSGVEAFRGLRERDVGAWQGLTRAEIEAKWTDAFTGGGQVDPPRAEPVTTLVGRALATIHRIAERHPSAAVVAVTHGGLVRNLERHLGIDPPRLPNLAGRWVEVHDGFVSAGERVLLIDAEEVPVTAPATPEQL